MSLKFLLTTFGDEDKQPKDTISLAGLLQRERQRIKARKGKFYPAGHNFNPSIITRGYCKRAKVAQLAGFHEMVRERPAPKLQLLFDMGHCLHDVIQGYFWEAGILEGEFRCLKCDKSWWDISPKTCPFVKSHERRHLEFREVTLKHEYSKISGRADGIIHVEVKKNQIERHFVDIKGIANKMPSTMDRQITFEDLDRLGPKEDHIIQLNLYFWLDGKIKDGHLLYVAKNTQQIKSFHIKYNYELIRPYLEDIYTTIEWAEDVATLGLPDPCDQSACLCENIVLPLKSNLEGGED